MRRLLLLSFIWGWSFLFIKVGVEGLTPSTVAAVRVALGAAVLHVFLRVQRVALPTRPADLGPLLRGRAGRAPRCRSRCWPGARSGSPPRSPPSSTRPRRSSPPCSRPTMLRDRLRSVQVVGLLVGIAGVGVAAGIGAGDLTGSSLAGGLASVLAGACYGLSFTWSKRHLMAHPADGGGGRAADRGDDPAGPVRDHDHRDGGRRHHLAPGRGHRHCSASSAPASPTSSTTGSSPTSGPPGPRSSPTSSRSWPSRSASSCSTSRSAGGSSPAACSSSPASSS